MAVTVSESRGGHFGNEMGAFWLGTSVVFWLLAVCECELYLISGSVPNVIGSDIII
jgi:hypothetical protein